MNTELVTASNTDVAPYQPPPDALSGIVKIRPSNIKLLQLTSRLEKNVPGKFHDTISGELMDSVTVIPLRITKSRVLFPPGQDFTQKPLCRSNDAIVPSQFAQYPQAKSCGVCSKGKWRKEGDKSIKPDCGESFDLMCVELESTLPAFIQFGGSGYIPFREFMERIERNRLSVMNKEKIAKPELFDYIFTITSQRVVKPWGTYYVPVFSNPQRVADPGKFGDLYQQYVVNYKQNIESEGNDVVDEEIDSALSGSGSVIDDVHTEA